MKKQDLAYDIANYMVHPADSIEIGGVSRQLLDIIRRITHKDKKLREIVIDYLEVFIEEGDCFVDEYLDNPELAIEDYDQVFYK